MYKENENTFIKYLSYLYYLHNPLSNYLVSYSTQELPSILKRDIFEDENYTFNSDFIKAEEIYKNTIINLPVKTLLISLDTLKNISNELENINYTEINDIVDKMEMMEKSLKVIEKLDVVTIKVNKAIKNIQNEFIVNTKNKKTLNRFEKPKKDR
jgi:hypothetical protein